MTLYPTHNAQNQTSQSRQKHTPFFRVVLTEHTKPAHAGYKQVLGWFNPIKHEVSFMVEEIKNRIEKGAKPSPRVAKLLFNETKDKLFQKFFVKSDRVRKKKKQDD